MRLIMLLVILWLTITGAAQDFPPDTIAPAPPSTRFLGTWEGEFQGENWITVKLAETGGKIRGAMRRRQVFFDSDGQITGLGKQQSEVPIRDAKPDGTILHFKVDNKDGSSEAFAMILVGDSSAEIRPLMLRRDRQVRLKPWKLTRTAPE